MDIYSLHIISSNALWPSCQILLEFATLHKTTYSKKQELIEIID